MKKVVFLGLGYTGLPMATTAADHGYEVVNVDVNPSVVRTTNQGKIHIVEPELDQIVEKVVWTENLRAVSEPEQADAFSVVVPTPFKQNHRADITYMESTIRSVISYLREDNLFMIESTLPVFTTERMAGVIYKERPGLKDKIYVAHCPERALPDDTLYELVHNDRVISGINPESTAKAIELYSAFIQGKLRPTNARTAEMYKLTENSSRNSQIVFASELSMVCDKAGINVWGLIDLANKHPRINILQPGYGMDGHCIAADPWFIVSDYPEQAQIVKHARKANDYKADWRANKVIEAHQQLVEGNDQEPVMTYMGLVFKPDIDDLRESPAKYIASHIVSESHAEALIIEPNTASHASSHLTDYWEAYKKADIAVWLVRHTPFVELLHEEGKPELDFCGARKQKLSNLNRDRSVEKILLVFGTRPEAIRMASLVKALQKDTEYFDTRVCVTTQHRQILDQMLEAFGIIPGYDLNIMASSQDLCGITIKVLLELRDILKDFCPDTVLVHGDTITPMVASLAAFCQQIAVGHVEASLRTCGMFSPWPEGMSRQVTGRIYTYYFTPTGKSKQNLLRENTDEKKIFVTGDTVVDALLMAIGIISEKPGVKERLHEELRDKGHEVGRCEYILVTGHHHENFGEGFLYICKAIKGLATLYPDMNIVYPIHLNLNVQKPVYELLSGVDNVYPVSPLGYLPSTFAIQHSTLLLTDSSGVQEKAPSPNKPVLVMRNTTGRPETVEAGMVKLMGTNAGAIVGNVTGLPHNKELYKHVSETHNPYGDGHTYEHIITALVRWILLPE